MASFDEFDEDRFIESLKDGQFMAQVLPHKEALEAAGFELICHGETFIMKQEHIQFTYSLRNDVWVLTAITFLLLPYIDFGCDVEMHGSANALMAAEEPEPFIRYNDKLELGLGSEECASHGPSWAFFTIPLALLQKLCEVERLFTNHMVGEQ